MQHTPNTGRFDNTKTDANLTSPFLVKSVEMTVAHVDSIFFGLHTLQGNQIIPDSYLESDGSYKLRDLSLEPQQ